MKLCNFLRFDPNYPGVGLKGGGKLEEAVWNQFSVNRDKLETVAKAIVSNAPNVPRPTKIETEQEDEEFEEGLILTRLHKIRERSPSVIAKKKKAVLKQTGKLVCEVCGFDFFKKYGQIGKGFAECHHTKPVSKLKLGEKTKLRELSILCANCHRMIHRTNPLLSLQKFKEQILP